MLGEPGRTNYDVNFRLFGIPVRIHPFFWLVALLLGSYSSGVQPLLSCVAAVFISILVHELGHAFVMIAYGLHPNIVLHGLGGLTYVDPADDYRSSKAHTTFGQISISFAGPLAGFLLAGALLGALYLAGLRNDIEFGWPYNLRPFLQDYVPLHTLVNYIFFISIFWGFVNLLPIYPLDGGQITREFLLYMNPREGIRQSLIISVLTAGVFTLVGIVRLHEAYVALLFGYLAYQSFMILQAYSRTDG